MIRLNLACGPNCFPGWDNVDRVDQSGFLHAMATAGSTTGWPEWQKRLALAAQRKEVNCSVWDLRRGFTEVYANDSVDCIYFGQAIEHLNPIHEVPKFLHECLRMLKPGGVLRITTPDLEQLLELYQKGRLSELVSEMPAFYQNASDPDRLSYLLYGSAGPECTWDNYEGHFHCYSPASMADALEKAGFGDPYRPLVPGIGATKRPKYPLPRKLGAQQTLHPTLFDGFYDQGMSYAFAVEVVKP